MQEKTYLAKHLDTAGDKSRYNEYVLSILTDKTILAHIMQGVVKECKHLSIEEIIATLPNKAEIQATPVHPGDSSPRVAEDKNEDIVPNEGTTTYDIRFHYITPKGNKKIKLLINIEAQKRFSLEYDLVTRAVYYGARMISSQRDTEFTGNNYDDIKDIYSIWICTESPQYAQNSIAEFNIQQKNIFGNFPTNRRYDILNIIFVCLGDLSSPDTPRFLSMLSTLLSNKINIKEKKRILEEEYHISMSNNLKKEVKDMCNLADAIEERGIQTGIQQGVQLNAIANAKRLFQNGVSYELVHASIDAISDEELQKIYNEVMEDKKA